jgi:hypothetical protein
MERNKAAAHRLKIAGFLRIHPDYLLLAPLLEWIKKELASAFFV